MTLAFRNSCLAPSCARLLFLRLLLLQTVTDEAMLQTVTDEAIWDWIDRKVPLSKNDTGLKRAVLTPQTHLKRFSSCVAERLFFLFLQEQIKDIIIRGLGFRV